MRKVSLAHTPEHAPQPPGTSGQDAAALRARREKVTGHLLARMRELEEDGLTVIREAETEASAGAVCICFPRLRCEEAARRLAKRGIATDAAAGTPGAAANGFVRMSVGYGSTFEEMDYVQGEVMTLLYG